MLSELAGALITAHANGVLWSNFTASYRTARVILGDSPRDAYRNLRALPW